MSSRMQPKRASWIKLKKATPVKTTSGIDNIRFHLLVLALFLVMLWAQSNKLMAVSIINSNTVTTSPTNKGLEPSPVIP